MRLGLIKALVVAAVVALIAGVMAVVAPAALPGSPFNAADGILDSVPGISVVNDQPSGQSDDSYKQGAKEADPCPTVASHKVPPHKDDLLKLYGGSRGSVLYLAWTRAPGGQGTASLGFELNQSGSICHNGVNPARTRGDLLVGYDFRGGNTMGVQVRTWNGSAWGSPVALDPTVAEASVSSDVLFGELAIDIKGVPGVGGAGQCATFVRGFAKSRASTSFSSALKDLIRPVALSVSTCAFHLLTLDVHKAVDGDGNGTFSPFGETATGGPGSPVSYLVNFINTSGVPVKIDSVVEVLNGTVTPVCAELLGDIVVDDSDTCTFMGSAPPAGTTSTDVVIVTVSAVGNAANTGSEWAFAQLTTPRSGPAPTPLSLLATKSADANNDGLFEIYETASGPGVPVTYRVRLHNQSATATVRIDEVIDTTGSTTTHVCGTLLGTTIAPGAVVTCTFAGGTTPAAGTTLINVVKATVSEVGNPSNTANDVHAATVVVPAP